MKQSSLSTSKRYLLTIVSLCSFFLLFLQTGAPTVDYLGHDPLEWRGGCQLGREVSPPLPESGHSYVLRPGEECLSTPFAVRSPHIDLEFALSPQIRGEDGIRFVLHPVERSEGSSAYSYSPLKGQKFGRKKWLSTQVAVPTELYGQQVQLQVQVTGGKAAWGAVRGRVNWLTTTPLGGEALRPVVEGFSRGGVIAQVIAQWCAILMLLYSVLTLLVFGGRSGAAFSFLLLGCGAHARLERTFFYDEFVVLQQFATEGFASVLNPHNEHFLPLFRLLYAAQIALFSDDYPLYLLISNALHLLNALLLYSLLTAIFGRERREVALVTTLLFAASALQSEALQWAMIQAILGCVTCLLASLLSGIAYIESGSKRAFGLTVVFTGAAPLFFANGFITLPFLVGFAALRRWGGSDRSRVVRRGALLVLTILIVAALGLWLQLRYTGGQTPLPPLRSFVLYLLVGAQVGTVLRSVGLFWNLEIRAPYQGVPKTFANAVAPGVDPLVVYFALGTIVSALLFEAVRRGGERRLLAAFGVGQLLLLVSFALPALGRSELGAFQALSARYQPIALVPFSLVVASVGCALGRRALPLAVTLLAAHLMVSLSFSDFQRSGAAIIVWREKMEEWHANNLPLHQLPVLTSRDVPFKTAQEGFQAFQTLNPER